LRASAVNVSLRALRPDVGRCALLRLEVGTTDVDGDIAADTAGDAADVVGLRFGERVNALRRGVEAKGKDKDNGLCLCALLGFHRANGSAFWIASSNASNASVSLSDGDGGTGTVALVEVGDGEGDEDAAEAEAGTEAEADGDIDGGEGVAAPPLLPFAFPPFATNGRRENMMEDNGMRMEE